MRSCIGGFFLYDESLYALNKKQICNYYIHSVHDYLFYEALAFSVSMPYL